jgi:hypothetical protein
MSTDIDALAQVAWQPIETAPMGGKILLWGKYWNDRDKFQHPLIGMWVSQENRWCVSGEFRFGVRPTHWMPLPAPPICTIKATAKIKDCGEAGHDQGQCGNASCTNKATT